MLKGVEFLLNQNVVHEKLSCAGILIDFEGNVKIYDIEHCKQSGDVTKLVDSFSRLMMMLMDKKRSMSALGLTRIDDWSDQAVDLLTRTTASPTVKQLLAHDFMQKKDQEELVWLVPLVLISAYHSRE